MDDLGLAVAVLLHEDGAGAPHVELTLDLLGDDGRGLVPADPLVLRDAARLGMAIPLGIPVDALQRVRDAVAREGVLLVRDRRRRDERVHGLLEHHAVVLELPGTEALHVVRLVVLQGTNAQDLVVLDVNPRDVASGTETAPVQVIVDCLVGTYASFRHILLQSKERTTYPPAAGRMGSRAASCISVYATAVIVASGRGRWCRPTHRAAAFPFVT